MFLLRKVEIRLQTIHDHESLSRKKEGKTLDIRGTNRFMLHA